MRFIEVSSWDDVAGKVKELWMKGNRVVQITPSPKGVGILYEKRTEIETR